VTKIVVTVAILLGAVALPQWIWDPLELRTSEKFFGASSNVSLFGVTISTHEAITFGVAVLIAVGLRVLFCGRRRGRQPGDAAADAARHPAAHGLRDHRR